MSNRVTGVLIVDDNEVDRYLLRRSLNRVDPPPFIFEAENGEQALAFFEERSSKQANSLENISDDLSLPALVFLDINMPGMNGLEFLDEFALLREKLTHIDSTVIMCSTARRAEEEQRALAHDFVKGYFAKGEVDDSVLSSILAQYRLSPTASSGNTESSGALGHI